MLPKLGSIFFLNNPIKTIPYMRLGALGAIFLMRAPSGEKAGARVAKIAPNAPYACGFTRGYSRRLNVVCRATASHCAASPLVENPSRVSVMRFTPGVRPAGFDYLGALIGRMRGIENRFRFHLPSAASLRATEIIEEFFDPSVGI